MYFRQILHPDLGCASYLIADRGEAAVLDPKWEIWDYLEAAAEAGAEICHVLETHNHADHVSGRRRLTSLTGAAIHLPAGGAEVGVRDGDIIRVGELELVALATPGHRPEHVSYLLREQVVPRLLLSGDSLLVGDVARPDLAVPAEEGARSLWHSLKRLLALDDKIEVWPAHVSGSLCASRSASSATSSTIGQERLTNPLLSLEDAGAFAVEVTRCAPARPPSVERVVALNQRGAADPGPVGELDANALGQFLRESPCIIDIRDPQSFDAGHLEGAINLPASRGLGTRAGWAAGPEEAIVLVAPSLDDGRRAAELLRAAGVWNVVGLSVADLPAWKAAGLRLRTSKAMRPDRLVPQISARAVTLIDVRDPAEWSTGHIAGSRSLPLSVLGDGSSASAFALEPPLAVVCASGIRAALAASILRRRGHDPVWRVSGGVEELARGGAPLASGQS